MCTIESYVFFDIETTGLPHEERNRTKITELSFVAVSRKDLLKTKFGDSPPVGKLTLVLNPTRPIHPKVVLLNGLSNDLLQHAPLFSQKVDTIFTFLQDLPKPVCLVAHNGNNFDFKIFAAECQDAHFNLPNDLLCVDSLAGFRKILHQVVSPDEKIATIDKQNVNNLLTDDEDEWPNLNVSTEEWDDIDKICDSLSDISCEDVTESKNNIVKKIPKKKAGRSKVIHDVFKKDDKKSKGSFTLLAIYKKFFIKEPNNHHRAEEDCMMLLQCVVAAKDHFIPWADNACRKLTDIQPLIRY